jgi:hypothetical protein
VFDAQVCLHDRLPGRFGWRLLRSFHQESGDFPEPFLQRLQQEIVLAREMFVEASMGEAGVPHHGGDGCAVQAFGTNTARGILHDFLADFRFVLGLIAHCFPSWDGVDHPKSVTQC